MKTVISFLAISALLLLTACGENDAVRAVEAYGFTSVVLGGTPFWGCSQSDNMMFNHYFTATNVNGRPVKGVVCGDMLKAYTVRIQP